MNIDGSGEKKMGNENLSTPSCDEMVSNIIGEEVTNLELLTLVWTRWTVDGNFEFDSNSKKAPVFTTKACSIGGAGTQIPLPFRTSSPGMSS
jgi:hypothetical protein